MCVLMLVGEKNRFFVLPASARWNEPRAGRVGSQRKFGRHQDDNPQDLSLVQSLAFCVFQKFLSCVHRTFSF